MALRQGVDCRRFDLSLDPPCDVDGSFDVAYCFEVAEHLPAQFGDRLVEFITAKAANVVFTAAAPGQIGLGHINCQPKEYWIERFESSDFQYCDALTEYAVWNFRDQEVIYWLINNVMIFSRADETA